MGERINWMDWRCFTRRSEIQIKRRLILNPCSRFLHRLPYLIPYSALLSLPCFWLFFDDWKSVHKISKARTFLIRKWWKRSLQTIKSTHSEQLGTILTLSLKISTNFLIRKTIKVGITKRLVRQIGCNISSDSNKWREYDQTTSQN